MTNQGDDAGDGFLVGAPSIEVRTSPCAEGFAANPTPVALPLAAVDTDVPFADLTPCGTVHVRAECLERIDDTPPSASSTEECHAIRSYFQLRNPTTV